MNSNLAQISHYDLFSKTLQTSIKKYVCTPGSIFYIAKNLPSLLNTKPIYVISVHNKVSMGRSSQICTVRHSVTIKKSKVKLERNQ